MLTVVCWYWHGWRAGTYSPEHVRRLRDMLAEHLTIPHRFYCITNEAVPGVDTRPLPVLAWQKHNPGIPSGYAKLWSLSDEAAELGPWLLSIDLDVLVLGNLDSLIPPPDQRPPLQIMRGVSCPYNSSLYLVKTGTFGQLWDNLNPDTARAANQPRMEGGGNYYGSDQAYMAANIAGAELWDHRHGVYQYATTSGRIPADCRLMFYAGRVKPWASPEAAQYWGQHRHVQSRDSKTEKPYT